MKKHKNGLMKLISYGKSDWHLMGLVCDFCGEILKDGHPNIVFHLPYYHNKCYHNRVKELEKSFIPVITRLILHKLYRNNKKCQGRGGIVAINCIWCTRCLFNGKTILFCLL